MNEHGLRQKITTTGEVFMEITYLQLIDWSTCNSHGTKLVNSRARPHNFENYRYSISGNFASCHFVQAQNYAIIYYQLLQ